MSRPHDEAPHVEAAGGPPPALVLRLALAWAEPRSLACCRAVSSLWREAASDQQVRVAAFLRHWQLAACCGQPKQAAFLETAGLSSFVVQHQVSRTDTLTMLAVRHGCSVADVKRVNQLMSEHSLHSRHCVYVPVGSREQVAGRLVRFHFDPTAARDFAVLCSQQQQQPGATPGQRANEEQRDGDDDGELQQLQGPRSSGWRSRAKVDAMQVKLCQALGRSLRVDNATAQFYLADHGGDIKAAMEACAQDLAWEGTTAGPIRTAPVQRWIRGEAGL